MNKQIMNRHNNQLVIVALRNSPVKIPDESVIRINKLLTVN